MYTFYWDVLYVDGYILLGGGVNSSTFDFVVSVIYTKLRVFNTFYKFRSMF